jgi:hypothetical protein
MGMRRTSAGFSELFRDDDDGDSPPNTSVRGSPDQEKGEGVRVIETMADEEPAVLVEATGLHDGKGSPVEEALSLASLTGGEAVPIVEAQCVLGDVGNLARTSRSYRGFKPHLFPSACDDRSRLCPGSLAPRILTFSMTSDPSTNLAFALDA